MHQKALTFPYQQFQIFSFFLAHTILLITLPVPLHAISFWIFRKRKSKKDAAASGRIETF